MVSGLGRQDYRQAPHGLCYKCFDLLCCDMTMWRSCHCVHHHSHKAHTRGRLAQAAQRQQEVGRQQLGNIKQLGVQIMLGTGSCRRGRDAERGHQLPLVGVNCRTATDCGGRCCFWSVQDAIPISVFHSAHTRQRAAACVLGVETWPRSGRCTRTPSPSSHCVLIWLAAREKEKARENALPSARSAVQGSSDREREHHTTAGECSSSRERTALF